MTTIVWRELRLEDVGALIAPYESRMIMGAQYLLLKGCALTDESEPATEAVQTMRYYIEAEGKRVPIYEVSFRGMGGGQRVVARVNALIFPLEGSATP